jgi:hypothetical protein
MKIFAQAIMAKDIVYLIYNAKISSDKAKLLKILTFILKDIMLILNDFFHLRFFPSNYNFKFLIFYFDYCLRETDKFHHLYVLYHLISSHHYFFAKHKKFKISQNIIEKI